MLSYSLQWNKYCMLHSDSFKEIHEDSNRTEDSLVGMEADDHQNMQFINIINNFYLNEYEMV